MYRRVVLRNVICTAGIAISSVISTAVVVIALLKESSENNKVGFACVRQCRGAFPCHVDALLDNKSFSLKAT